MKRSNEQISALQATVVTINYILAAGILTLPRTTVAVTQTPDAWISVLLAGLIIIGVGIVMVMLCQRFPGETLFQFLPRIVGRPVAWLLGGAIVLYFLCIAAFEIRVLAEVTGMYLLEGTPSWAVIMVFMWVGIYLISGGLQVIVRLFEIILPISIIIFVLVIFLSRHYFELNNLRPVLGDGWLPVLKGLKPTLLAYTGYEGMLVLMASMRDPSKGKKAMAFAIAVPMLMYLMTIVMVVGTLSVEGVQGRVWPTLDLMRSFEIEGLFFERFESLLLVIWIMQIFSSGTITHYLASVGCAQLGGTEKTVRIMYVLLPVIYIIAMVPKSLEETMALGDMIGYASVGLFVILPLLLLIASIIMKKGGGADDQRHREQSRQAADGNHHAAHSDGLLE